MTHFWLLYLFMRSIASIHTCLMAKQKLREMHSMSQIYFNEGMTHTKYFSSMRSAASFALFSRHTKLSARSKPLIPCPKKVRGSTMPSQTVKTPHSFDLQSYVSNTSSLPTSISAAISTEATQKLYESLIVQRNFFADFLLRPFFAQVAA